MINLNITFMFNSTLSSALLSLTPFWSNELVKQANLGNEYSMAITMIFTELIKYITPYMSDGVSGTFACCFILLIIVYGCGFNLNDYVSIFKNVKTITTTASVLKNGDKHELKLSKTFKALNQLLIIEYKVSQLQYLNCNNSDIIVDTVTNYKLEHDLYLTVANVINEKSNTITIKLSSHHKNLHKLTEDAVNKYSNNNKRYKLELVGEERNGLVYNYPEHMKILTYVLVNKYDMKKNIILNTPPVDSNYWESRESSTEKKVTNLNKTTKEEHNEKANNLTTALDDVFLLETCNECTIKDDITISINRINDTVTYNLCSDVIDLKLFLKECIAIYKELMGKTDYTFKVTITGNEYTTCSSEQLK